jgi:hypothetical protein
LAKAGRIIVGWGLYPSSEITPVTPMLDQAASAGTVETALFDAGYFNEAVVTATGARNIELFSPEGRTEDDGARTRQSSKQYPKSKFIYRTFRTSARPFRGIFYPTFRKTSRPIFGTLRLGGPVEPARPH